MIKRDLDRATVRRAIKWIYGEIKFAIHDRDYDYVRSLQLDLTQIVQIYTNHICANHL